MKKTVFPLIVLALLSIGVAEEAAAQTCHTVTGPHWWNARTWYTYSIPTSCYTTVNATPTTSSCGFGAWALGNSGTAYYRFTVGSQVIDPDKWQVSTRIYFDIFSANTGDDIEVVALAAAGSGSPTITAEYPSVTNNSF
jgi:hypothetical protein